MTTLITGENSPNPQNPPTFQPITFVWDETLRVKKLQEYQIMHTQPEQAFDRIVDLVKRFFAVPIVAINFIDDAEQFTKSSIGLDETVFPKSSTFCQETIQGSQIVVIPDTLQRADLAQHPFVNTEMPVRFYAGCPIIVYDNQNHGYVLGSLCIADMQAQLDFGENERTILQQFSDMIADELELRLQKYKAERAGEIKSAFLANMSHEIRTPMNGIMGMLDLLEHTGVDEQQKDYIKHIRHSNEHLLNVISDILDLSKIESGQMNFQFVPVDLKQLCSQILAVFVTDAKAHDVQLVFDYPDDLPTLVKADPVRVRQILANLVNNAIKFTPANGTVTLRAINCCDDCEIKLQVVDTGIGIRKETQAVIFDAYNQADKFTHRMYGGTGLGLSVCKALAEGMGGTITLDSEEGKGSTFSLCLPLEVLQNADNLVLSDTENTENDERLSAHILLAEDNHINAMVAIKSLKKFGYTVDLAKDGNEAVTMFSQNPQKYQIILMDHQMPIMDGVQATKILKKSFHKLPPIIAVTAHATHGDKQTYLNAGMQDYCTKPYKPEFLDKMIQGWLKKFAIIH